MLTQPHAPTDAALSEEGGAIDARSERLIARCWEGDRDGFGELVVLTEPRVRRLLGRLVGRGADLDDLVQDRTYHDCRRRDLRAHVFAVGGISGPSRG
jgi:hypothetical protein